ncbi:uncharacterized protein LOC104584127 [Brachypodium distachyon]|uniref:uncharacterized protein LOC104584127 n=1 Tax=Brachypodium distachyon TaxID=15368 RepID=UPI00053004BB|nr:uncharacterized protein LOC104584127 [Brachypodium distachyon]|eukprot:XP_010236569.1 uncharacterized protein LOC104584127 [Brachypodium distachyon]
MEQIRTWLRGITGDNSPFAGLPLGGIALHVNVANPGAINYPPCNEWGIMVGTPSSSPPPRPRARTGKQPVAESEEEDDSDGDSEGPVGASAGYNVSREVADTSGDEGSRGADSPAEGDSDDNDVVPLSRLPAASGVEGSSELSTGNLEQETAHNPRPERGKPLGRDGGRGDGGSSGWGRRRPHRPGSVAGVDPAIDEGGRQEVTDAEGGDTAQAPPAAATAGAGAAELTPGSTAADAGAAPEVTVEQAPIGQSGGGGHYKRTHIL